MNHVFHPPHDAPISSAQFKDLMRNIASSVAVITTRHNGEAHGMTATAIASVTADPPTILIAVNRSTRSYPLISANGRFAVNILSPDQRHIAERFSGKADDQFEGIAHTPGRNEIPLLSGAVVTLECTVTEQSDVGTHTVFLGQVVDGRELGGNPLVYHNGSYKKLELG